ncbi:MAG: LysR family transcriptional regulator [Clostridia bacterium]|nr:LysR family transcriptional regulator [Clostridia bacterium]
MNMKQIEFVLTIAEEGSINKAAQKLYQSQSNLSTALRNLEEDLGQPLFERNGNGTVLTTFGKDFIMVAQPVYNQYKMLNDFLDSASQPTPTRFSVAVQNFRFAATLFSEICQKYEAAPHAFSFLEGSMFEVIDMVSAHEAELGLIVVPSYDQKLIMYTLKQKEIRYKCLAKVRASVMMRAGHPLLKNGKETIDPAELRNYPIIRFPDTSYTTFPDWNALSLNNSKKQIIVSDRGSLYEILTSTNAFTLGAHKGSAYEKSPDYPGIKVVHLAGFDNPLEIGCIQLSNYRLSAIAEEYLAMLQEALK